MRAKETLIGTLLIIIGALPFLLMIESVSTALEEFTIYYLFTPGEIVYQLAIIVLGVLLLWRPRIRVEHR